MVRYGVAPDHPEVKNVINEFETIAQTPGFQFFGNVQVGKDVSVEDLKKQFDAIVLCYGADSERKLNVTGESLEGVISSTDFVNWYNGLPDPKNQENKWFYNKTQEFTKLLHSTKSVVIVGQGNVALDVGRILMKPISDLKSYDLPEQILDILEKSKIQTVHIVGRRGPVQAAFTTKEFRELTKVQGISVEISKDDMNFDEYSKKSLEEQGRPRKRFIQALQETINEMKPLERSVQLKFFKNPVEILGEKRVQAVKFEETKFEGEKLIGTGKFIEIPCEMVFKCIGFQSSPLPGIPFKNGIVVNEKGRVGDGIYVSGWLKRGPVGVIATNLMDARETVDEILQDFQKQPATEEKQENLKQLFDSRNIKYVTFDQFKEIDKFEVEKGKVQGKIREKVVSKEEMLKIAHKK